MLKETHNQKHMLDVLEIVLYHCKLERPPGDTLFVTFCKTFEDSLRIQGASELVNVLLDTDKTPSMKEVHLKHLRALYETTEVIASGVLINAVPNRFKVPLGATVNESAKEWVDEQKKQVAKEICAKIGALLLAEQGSTYALNDLSARFAAETAGMRRFETVLRCFICRHLLKNEPEDIFQPSFVRMPISHTYLSHRHVYSDRRMPGRSNCPRMLTTCLGLVTLISSSKRCPAKTSFLSL